MKRIYLVFIVLIGISISCTKNYEDFNTDKKKPVEVPGNALFANAQKALADQIATPNVNFNIWRMMAQYWTATTYTDEPNYDIFTRAIPDDIYQVYYRNVLSDFYAASNVISEEQAVGDEASAAKQNRLHIITLIECYTYQELVDMFGNIPYFEACNIDIIHPAYDDAATIYSSLIERVTAATEGLDAAYGSFGSEDLYMSGDVAMWKKFGYSLLVKLGINLADVNSSLAKSTIEGAYAGAFAFGETCQINYPGGSNANQLYIELIASGRHDFVPCATMVDIMNTLNDPRRDNYFTLYDNATPDDPSDDIYIGGAYGAPNNFTQYSGFAEPILQPTFPMVLMDYTEVAFYLAEAAARGYSVGDDAATWYNNAVKSSILHWDGTSDEYDAYIATVPYDGGNWKQNIGTQAWLAFYIRGFPGYTSWRRLDVPTLIMPPNPDDNANGQIPTRFTYPVNEQTLNKDNYDAAAKAIGGDFLYKRIFWDLPPSK
jgi:hypothetical protein